MKEGRMGVSRQAESFSWPKNECSAISLSPEFVTERLVCPLYRRIHCRNNLFLPYMALMWQYRRTAEKGKRSHHRLEYDGLSGCSTVRSMLQFQEPVFKCRPNVKSRKSNPNGVLNGGSTSFLPPIRSFPPLLSDQRSPKIPTSHFSSAYSCSSSRRRWPRRSGGSSSPTTTTSWTRAGKCRSTIRQF